MSSALALTARADDAVTFPLPTEATAHETLSSALANANPLEVPPPVAQGEDAFNKEFDAPHQVAALDNGPAAFEARLRMIQNAQKEIDLEYFIWEPDEAGRILLQALLEKKKQMDASGKPFRIRMILDRLFPAKGDPTGLSDAVVQKLIQGGIEVKYFHFGVMPWTYNYRSHKKIFLVDGSSFITGGRNIENPYFGFGKYIDSRKYNFNYYDMEVYVHGPAAGGAQGAFEAYWKSRFSSDPTQEPQSKKDVKGAEAILSMTPELQAAAAEYHQNGSQNLDQVPVFSAFKVSYVSDKLGTRAKNRRTEPAVLDMEQSANQRVLMENFLLIARDRERKVFDDLLARGASVDFLTNGFHSQDDSPTMYLAYPELVRYSKKGMHVYSLSGNSQTGTSVDELNDHATWGTHSKVSCVDTDQKNVLSTCYIGTANNDPRSENINAEDGVIVRDNPDFAKQVEQSINARIKVAFPLTPEGRYIAPGIATDGTDCVVDVGPSPMDEAKLRSLGITLLKLTDRLE